MGVERHSLVCKANVLAPGFSNLCVEMTETRFPARGSESDAARDLPIAISKRFFR